MVADLVAAAVVVVIFVIGGWYVLARQNAVARRRQKSELDQALRLASLAFASGRPPSGMTRSQRELAAGYYSERFVTRGDPTDKERVEALQVLED